MRPYLLALLLAGGAAAQQAVPASVEREWRVRAWALQPAERADELRAALSSGSWTEQDAALDALERALRVGTLCAGDPLVAELEARVLPILFDQSSAAEARALHALAVWPRPLALAPADLEPLTAHPSPAVRLALIRFLESRGDSPLALVADADERVARAAVQAELALGSPLFEIHRERLRAEPELYERQPLSSEALDGLLRDARALEDAELEARVEALRLRWHGAGELAPLAAVWGRAEDRGLRRVLTRAARAARARELALGELLFDAALAAGADPARARLLEGAVEASDPEALLVRARLELALPTEAQVELWELLLGRSQAWSFAVVHPWLDPALDLDVRGQVVAVLATAPIGGAGDAVGELLAVALGDPDAGLSSDAFRALAGAPQAEDWFGELHRAWSRRPRSEQLELLERLPRNPAPLPFHASLVTIAREDAGARPEVLELLTEIPGEPPLLPEVERWLTEEVTRMLALPAAERRPAELRCTGIARSLARLGKGRAVPVLSATLERVAGESDEVGKVLLMLLGELDRGRARIAPWLADDVPARLRIEAALQLAPTGDAEALAVLVERYETCDWELRVRALKALRGLSDGASLAFLRAVALDEEVEFELRNLAVHGIARRGNGQREIAVLGEVLASTRDPEVIRAVVGSLAVLGGEDAREILRGRLRRVEVLPLVEGAGAEIDLALDERDALLPALLLAEGGAWSPALAAAWLRLPEASAAEDLAARFEGRKLPASAFRWSGELSLAEVQARTGGLPAALEGAPAWWRLDARFLAALASLALDAEAGAALRRAALVGLAGEGDAPDRAALELRLQHELLELAEARRDWAVFAALGARMLADWRAGRTSERDWTRIWGGDYRPAEGRDPEARLASAIVHARAWAALDAGRPDEARALCDEARGRLGFSAAARTAQDRLETELGERERGR